jgi:hypothetical protein
MASESSVLQLTVTMARAVAMFRALGQSRWAEWFERDIRLIEAGDFFGVEHVLSAYGGAGSVNDLLFANGDSFERHPDLDPLLTEIHDIASQLKRARDNH